MENKSIQSNLTFPRQFESTELLSSPEVWINDIDGSYWPVNLTITEQMLQELWKNSIVSGLGGGIDIYSEYSFK